ncbi:lasso peptide biosynthesis B2 protein [Desulforamulus aquiferis]|uniref:lasso peptide biosynthesis B2 protein n=1 Tax=Desulforamulus aquiferis TaxID=1397668 RepID=UPI0027156000|nr:lasso peptide biosynthesis B2 protein [Desulforamulus aquiferis]
MLRLLKNFIIMSWREQRLFLEAYCLTGIVRLAIILFPFRRIAPFLGKYMAESSMLEDSVKLAIARRIGQLVTKASRFTPWESKCLVQAMVCKIMLRRRKINSTLYMGVGRDKIKGLVAHAWLRCGKTIISGAQGIKNFTTVGKFADLDGG